MARCPIYLFTSFIYTATCFSLGHLFWPWNKISVSYNLKEKSLFWLKAFSPHWLDPQQKQPGGRVWQRTVARPRAAWKQREQGDTGDKNTAYQVTSSHSSLPNTPHLLAATQLQCSHDPVTLHTCENLGDSLDLNYNNFLTNQSVKQLFSLTRKAESLKIHIKNSIQILFSCKSLI